MADILILDAMGVLYEAGDDVAELLVPFVGRHGRTGLSAEAIDRDYVEASLGQDGHGGLVAAYGRRSFLGGRLISPATA